MANRCKEWSEDISKKLKSRKYRKEFFLSLVNDEAMSIREAIYVICKSMGNREFASLIKMAPSNVSRIVNPDHDIKTTTLEFILKQIGCSLSVKAS